MCENNKKDEDAVAKQERRERVVSVEDKGGRRLMFRIPGDTIEKLSQVSAENELGIDPEKVSKWFKNTRYMALRNRKTESKKRPENSKVVYEDPGPRAVMEMTKEAEDLLEEQDRLIEENGDKAAEHVTRCLMMFVDKKLPLDKIIHFRRGFGLLLDFRINWVHKFPQLFKVVKVGDDGEEYLELVSWNPAWAITELEKKTLGLSEESDHKPGLFLLAFPMKFPPLYKKMYRYRGKIEHFQKRPYLSPYADARGLEAGSKEFDKRAIAVMHELLSFTLEKRLVTDHLTHFRREFVMPQKLMRIFLKHCGIFYVSERGKRFNVFLTEAYEGQELIEKCPMILWKEKLLKFVGYRGRKRDEQKVNMFKGDILTKVLGGIKFKEMRDFIGIQNLSKQNFKLKGENVVVSLKEA